PPAIYTLSLHDALPISPRRVAGTPWSTSPFIRRWSACTVRSAMLSIRVPQLVIGPRSCWTKDFVLVLCTITVSLPAGRETVIVRSEEHTSELQSLAYLV